MSDRAKCVCNKGLVGKGPCKDYQENRYAKDSCAWCGHSKKCHERGEGEA